MSSLFSPLTLRNVRFRNRAWVSPMCQYSSREGFPTDWHFVHLGSRAVGGAGLVLVEATAVAPEGRISPDDSGIWLDGHARAFRRITGFVREQGAVPGIQLAHAGRKASTASPWNGGALVPPSRGGWRGIAPSAVPFRSEWPAPREMGREDMARVLGDFEAATRRSLEAGFELVELHMAHGYLLHEFLSPLSNRRNDEYGGSFENRIRFPLEVGRAVRAAWPVHLPLFARISATDWVDGGWDLAQSVRFAAELGRIGVDLIDCSSGGLVPDAAIPEEPSYQVPFAERIRAECGISTAAVGRITRPEQAQAIVARGQADAVFLARELLRDPYWPLHAAKALGAEIEWPRQYLRASN